MRQLAKYDFFLHRRDLLRNFACTCAGAVSTSVMSGLLRPALASGTSATDATQPAKNAFFLCDTPQITDITVQVQELSSTERSTSGDVIVDQGTGRSTDQQIVNLDEYTTAQANLRWRAKDVQLTRDGKPVVRVKCIDGTDWQHREVERLSRAWLDHSINVGFEFVQPNDRAEVRISFLGGVNKSATGIEARGKPASSATMFLPSVHPGEDESIRRRVVLHEFGHGIMTFGHEHRHAAAELQFVSDSAIRDSINAMLGKKSWTIGMVRSNITNPPYSPARTCTTYDVRSIMHYPIQPEWLAAGTPVPDAATTLSARDIACARRVYG